MKIPSLSWIGFNIFRLTAISILCWSLVTQFIAIGDDMSAYSKAASNVFNTSHLATTSDLNNLTTSSNPYAAPTAKSSIDIIETLSPKASPTDRAGGSLNSVSSVQKRASSIVGKGVELPRSQEANWGLSSIPRHGGGAAFSVISRLVMVTTLIVLAFGQLGWPEMFLYKHVPWLGPQSTPIWLGLVQTIVAIENLRVYAKSFVLTPSWALFAIGSVNVIVGGFLLYLGRKLPKNSSPELYFNHSIRLLYFLPPPQCYKPVLHPAEGNKHEMEDLESGKIDTHNLAQSNSKSIGLDSEDEDKMNFDEISIHSEILPIQSQYLKHPLTKNQQGRNRNDFSDVTKGGYPTFSGGGLTNPERQVPTGFIEHTKDGQKIEFISERTGQPIKNPTAHSKSSNDQAQRRSQLPPRNHSKKKVVTTDMSENSSVIANPFIDSKLLRVDQSVSNKDRADSINTLDLLDKGKSSDYTNSGIIDAARYARMRNNLSTTTFGPGPTSSSSPKHSKYESKLPNLPEHTKVLLNDTSDMSDDLVKRSSSNLTKKQLQERQSNASYLSATRDIAPKFPYPPSRHTSVRSSGGERTVSDEGKSHHIQPIGLVEEAKGPRPPLRAGSKREKPKYGSEQIKNEHRTEDKNRARSYSTDDSPTNSNTRRYPLVYRSISNRSSKGDREAKGVRFHQSPIREPTEFSGSESGSEWTAGSKSDSEESEEEVGQVRKLAPKGSLDITGEDKTYIDTVGTPTQRMIRPESLTLDNMDFNDAKKNGSDSKNPTIKQTKGKSMVLGGDHLSGGKENYI
ncbi:uncharacterized protein L201_002928 [Kwoniella dendrophila CBS 6074]|uniref:Uncharacterized protein n=1 Tax=Kwoniella dendrophila CBS 6074 TaxID=1295534 RepID=A0AAX4JTW2_9TREE